MELRKLGFALVAVTALLAVLLGIVKANFDSQAAFLCEKFHENQLDMQQCPAHKSNTSWIITASFALVFALMALGLFLITYKPPGAVEKPAVEVDLSKLDSDEAAVYGTMKAGSGSSYQGDLVKATGFSKVKVTRVLDRLESRGVVERKRRGMTNLVVLR